MRIEPETGVGQAASLFGERSSPWASYARLCRQEHWRSLREPLWRQKPGST
jgi:hypothetical protein